MFSLFFNRKYLKFSINSQDSACNFVYVVEFVSVRVFTCAFIVSTLEWIMDGRNFNKMMILLDGGARSEIEEEEVKK